MGPGYEAMIVLTVHVLSTTGNRQSDNTVEIAVPIAATIAVFLIIAIIGLLIWLGYKKRQSNKWNDYLRVSSVEID